MPKRTRFVRGDKVRIQLVDVHRQLHQDLISKGVLLPKGKDETIDKYRPATPEEIAASSARVHQAAEDGDWIDVKKALSAGETRKLFTDIIKNHELISGERPALDPERVGITTIVSYLLAWSFLDEGEPIPYSVIAMSEDERVAIINRLDPEDYQELDTAINQHMAAMAAAKEDEKKTRTTPSTAAATS